MACPLSLGTDPDDRADGAVDGRGPGREPVVREVVRVSVVGRVTPLVCMDAAEGGREKLGRAEEVPLKDCREEERAGVLWEDG